MLAQECELTTCLDDEVGFLSSDEISPLALNGNGEGEGEYDPSRSHLVFGRRSGYGQYS